MLIEQLIFTVVAFAIFVYMFFKMIKANDTSYIVFLVLEAIGIGFNFVEVIIWGQIKHIVKNTNVYIFNNNTYICNNIRKKRF